MSPQNRQKEASSFCVITRILRARNPLAVLLVGCVLFQPGCARSPLPPAPSPAAVAPKVLSPEEAATLAARLANDQCQHQFGKHPFTAKQYLAVLQGGVYRWGGLDTGAVGGFSALVTFQEDGGQPHVEVYFSSDALKAR